MKICPNVVLYPSEFIYVKLNVILYMYASYDVKDISRNSSE
jgi:hypothetical protein